MRAALHRMMLICLICMPGMHVIASTTIAKDGLSVYQQPVTLNFTPLKNSLETKNTTNKGIFLSILNTGTTSSDIFRVVVSNITGTWYVLSIDPQSIIHLSETPLVFVLGPYQDKSFDVKLSPGQKIGWHAISPVGAYYAMSQNPYPTSKETAIAAFCILSIDMIARGLFTIELPVDFIPDTNTFFGVVDDVVGVLKIPTVNMIVELMDQLLAKEFNWASATTEPWWDS
jgi:hypothetical protein